MSDEKKFDWRAKIGQAIKRKTPFRGAVLIFYFLIKITPP